MYVTSRSNLVVGLMTLFDTFMDDFRDEKFMEAISDLDVRAQLEVRHFHCDTDCALVLVAVIL